MLELNHLNTSLTYADNCNAFEPVRCKQCKQTEWEKQDYIIQPFIMTAIDLEDEAYYAASFLQFMITRIDQKQQRLTNAIKTYL